MKMSTTRQLTFWDKPITEDQIIWTEMADLKTRQNNLRRGIFQRFDELEKEVELLRDQLLFLTGKKAQE